MLRVAHFSDIHVTVPPPSQGLGRLLSKRAMGALNYYVGGRKKHFANVEHRIERLLADVDAQNVQHAICTGDITQTSLEVEFERCAALFGERVDAPQRYTVIPGNHDRYTKGADRDDRFERWFGKLASPAREYPFVKTIADGVTVIGLDVARPTSLIDSSGLCGSRQLNALRELLHDPSLKTHYVMLALHYGLLRRGGVPDRKTHRVQDYEQILALIDEEGASVDLVIHGHMHGPYTVQSKRKQIICAGSATDLYGACGYNVYSIEPQEKKLTIERRVWSASDDAYIAHPSSS